MTTQDKKKAVIELVHEGANQLLKGSSPKNFKTGLINKGITENSANVITDEACRIKSVLQLANVGANQLLKGLLPKNFKRGLINKGISEDLANLITDEACRIANEFSHYKIGGKYCKENKNQQYK